MAIAVFPVFWLLTDFVCLLIYEFCLSLWKIARCSVILLLPLFAMALIEVTGFNSRLTSLSGILLRGEVCLAYTTTLTPPSFTEVPVRIQENKGSCICVLW